MIIRGIPVAILLSFVVLVFIEIAKRYWIKDEANYDFIPYILVGIALIFGSVGAWVYDLDFITSFTDVLVLLASGGIFKFIKLIAPDLVDVFERNERDVPNTR